MTVELALRQKLAAADERAEDWKRRAEHAEAQLKIAMVRMSQAEANARGLVAMWCECAMCSKRRATPCL